MKKPRSKKQNHPQRGSPSAAGFLAALDQASKENYLGDPKIISKLLLDYSHDAILRRTSKLPAEESDLRDHAHALALADIFLGRVPAFAPMIPWNSPGHIDQWLAEELKPLNVTGETPESVVANTMICYLNECYQLSKLAAKGVSREEWETRFVETALRFTKLLLGVPTLLAGDDPREEGKCG